MSAHQRIKDGAASAAKHVVGAVAGAEWAIHGLPLALADLVAALLGCTDEMKEHLLVRGWEVRRVEHRVSKYS